jgi:ribosomal protein S18 acetylase RimI-like enzyme
LKRDDIQFRDEAPQDQEFLFHLYASTRAQEMALAPWDAAQTESFLRSQFHLQAAHYHRYYPEAAFLVIQGGGQPIGRLYVDRRPDEIHILDIALVPERRGEGIGTALLKELLSEAEESGKVVILYVEQFNPAHRLYLRLGFQPVKDEGVYWMMQWSSGRSGLAKPLASGEAGDSSR